MVQSWRGLDLFQLQRQMPPNELPLNQDFRHFRGLLGLNKGCCPAALPSLLGPARCWELPEQSRCRCCIHPPPIKKSPLSGELAPHSQMQPSSCTDVLQADGRKHQGSQAPSAQPTVDGEQQLFNSICCSFLSPSVLRNTFIRSTSMLGQ